MIDLYHTALLCHRCDASTWEAVDTRTFREHGRNVPHDVIECCFCGVMMSVPSAKQPSATKQRGEFRFQFGRFKGLTFAEADAEPNGRRYLEHLRDTNEKLRERIAEYLAENALDSSATDREIVALSELSGVPACHEKRPSSQRLFG